jgi:hypothetical protein
MTDEEITKAAREICAAQAEKSDTPEMSLYMSGAWDHTVVMRLVERCIRRGLKGQAMVKTQHCPNCEATEQKLHDFRQEVSDAVEEYYSRPYDFPAISQSFIITKPQPDPLVEVVNEVARELNITGASSLHTIRADTFRDKLRAALDDLGFEIREKGQ